MRPGETTPIFLGKPPSIGFLRLRPALDGFQLSRNLKSGIGKQLIIGRFLVPDFSLRG